jgi:hypothetical protein
MPAASELLKEYSREQKIEEASMPNLIQMSLLPDTKVEEELPYPVRWAQDQGFDPCELPRFRQGRVWHNTRFEYPSLREARQKNSKVFVDHVPGWVYPIYVEAKGVFGAENIRVYSPDPDHFIEASRIECSWLFTQPYLKDPMLIATWREGDKTWHFRLAIWGIGDDLSAKG